MITTIGNKMYDLDTMKQIHIVYRADVIDIFKDVLNDDVAKNIASYIAHPIHEYIGKNMLYLKKTLGLRLKWSNYSMSANYFIHNFGYKLYEEERVRDIMVINNKIGNCLFAKPYLPVNLRTLRNEIMWQSLQNGIKICKNWNKKKLIQHYYKSIN